MKKQDIIKYGLILYALGILLALPASYSFFLGTYGQGGVAEHRGRIKSLNKHFPEDTDYILFNHGNVTPISKQYFDHIKRARSVGNIIYFVGLPFLIAGLITYGTILREAKQNWQVLWFALFIPGRKDPFITFFAKLYFLLIFMCLIVCAFIFNINCSEDIYLTGIYLMYAIIACFALSLTFIIRKNILKKPNEAASPDG